MLFRSYVGFAKNQTLLTVDTPDSLGSGGEGPDKVTVVEKDETIRLATEAGIDSFFINLYGFDTNQFSNFAETLSKMVFTNVSGTFLSSSLMTVSDQGNALYEQSTKANGGEITWFWEGTIKIYWHTFAFGEPALNARTTTVISKPAGSGLRKVTKTDFDAGGDLYSMQSWGMSASDPLKITGSGKIHKQIRRMAGDSWRLEGPELGSGASWSFSPPSGATYKRPYAEEKFVVDYEITISAQRYGSDYVSKQKFKSSSVVSPNDLILGPALNATK